MSEKLRKNRLSLEKSPYLLQHQYNPVDWYPWGEEAFERARAENKLVFLSIGYSTCHWCHVMEKESFENDEVADLLNESFISIKVDREERSDLDQIYMNAVQMITGSGGWPLTVFLTPDKKPVTGGTYFPPDDKWGRPGMKTVLPHLNRMWQEDPNKMIESGDKLTEVLRQKNEAAFDGSLSDEIFHKAYEQLFSLFDPSYGGFGAAPKFPKSHDLSFLLRYFVKFKQPRALEIVQKTLQCMAEGGLYDHLGGGFARYSTDEKWLVPHFEKMLYDQAVLLKTYTECYQVSPDAWFKTIASGIADYVLHQMRNKEGAFYSAEDADSEGEEGKFYVWTPAEIEEVLGSEADAFMQIYGVNAAGNFENHTSILHLKQASREDHEAAFKSQAHNRKKLFEKRASRIRPHLDDKILTSWNGLMISSLAFAGKVFDRADWIEAAAKAARFILDKLETDGTLYRRHREGESAVEGLLDDYSFLLQGLLDLYEVTFDEYWLIASVPLAETMIRQFWDEESGGFYYASAEASDLIARVKDYYDGAAPSGNSMAACVLLKLGRLLGNAEYENKAAKVLHSNGASLKKSPMHFTQGLMALDCYLSEPLEIVVIDPSEKISAEEIQRILSKRFIPNATVAGKLKSQSSFWSDHSSSMLSERLKASQELSFFICQNKTCGLPIHSLETFETELDKLSGVWKHETV